MPCTEDACTGLYDGTVSLGSILLPRDSVWVDFGNFDYYDASKRYTLGGRLVICQAPKSKGEPITLRAEWVCKDTLDEVIAHNKAGQQSTLTYCGTDYTVCWDFASRPALKVTPVIEMACYEVCSDSRFNLEMKFIQV